jgi:hypothetical protein
MTRTHARTPVGERAVDAVPKNWGDNVTVTAALTLDGIVAPMMLYGAMTARAFEAYIEQCLGPELRPGDVVVLDKLTAHKTHRVRELVADSAHRDRPDRRMVIARIGHRDRSVGAKRRSWWRVRGWVVRPPAFFGTVP